MNRIKEFFDKKKEEKSKAAFTGYTPRTEFITTVNEFKMQAYAEAGIITKDRAAETDKVIADAAKLGIGTAIIVAPIAIGAMAVEGYKAHCQKSVTKCVNRDAFKSQAQQQAYMAAYASAEAQQIEADTLANLNAGKITSKYSTAKKATLALKARIKYAEKIAKMTVKAVK